MNTAFHKTPRSGVMMIEVLVAASILMVALSVMVTATIRTGRLWLRIERRSAAMSEANLLLDGALRVARDWEVGLNQPLSIDPAGQRSVPGLRALGTRLNDDAGDRVRLTIDWDRDSAGGVPLVLVGWLNE